MNDWRERARNLTDQLDAAGVLAPGWRDAFENTPRHVLVPSFVDDDGSVVDSADPAQHGHWLDAVYRDQTLVTQVTAVPGQAVSWPTSSATRPSMQALMLGMLGVNDGNTVLDIGTGPAANVAMLCHRLGAGNVASIDIDPAIIDQARERLASIGYRPHLVAGNGAVGIAERAPYDRIIASCAVQAIPPAWVAQLKPRGTIVADVRSDLSGSLVTLIKLGDGTVQGRFVTPGHFMWLRARAGNPLRDGGALNTTIDRTGAEASTTDLDPQILNDPDLRFMLTLCLPELESAWSIESENGPSHLLRLRDGSWAEVAQRADHGRFATVQGGPRPVWPLVDAVVSRWENYRRPGQARFGMTADVNGTQTYWLDLPGNTINTITASRGKKGVGVYGISSEPFGGGSPTV